MPTDDQRPPDAIAHISLATKDHAALAAELGRSFEDNGFAIVSDHGVPPALIERVDDAARRLFALPEAEKLRWHQADGGARGYTPFGREIAKGGFRPDSKEFWHVGRELAEGNPLSRVMTANVWPEVEGFKAATLELYAALEHVGMQLLSAIAIHLGLPADHYDGMVRDGNSILRLLHYPPTVADPGAVRAAAHEDINVITLLLGAEEAGLELLDRQGRWIPVTPPSGALAVNVGDMLQRQTKGRMRSTSHRVVAPAADRAHLPRYSMPFFLHFRPDVIVDDGPPPVTAHEYLMERLRQLGLIG